jgi:hypothetical protein
MQYLLEIDERKDKFILEVLKNFRYVKTHPLNRRNKLFLFELQQSAEQVRLAKKGKIRLQKAKDLLNEL